MSGFRTPPQSDFRSYAALISAQGDHFGELGKWCTTQCANADGLEGLLYLVRPLVSEFAGFFGEKIGQCGRGMTLVASKVHQTSEAYSSTDQNLAVGLAKLYPTTLPAFPDIGALSGLPHLGNFTDQSVELGTDDLKSAEADTAKAIELQVDTIRNKNFTAGPLAVANKVFKYFTGQDLVELLLDPIIGKFGRLKYLHDVYDKLGDGIYTVAGTLRKGSWALGQEWTGQAAVGFDSYMFSWSMGIGGLGDAAKLVAKIYKDGFDAVILLVQAALREINKLMVDVLPKLAKDGGEMIAGDAAIEAIGGGPEDPVADVVAGIFTVDKMYQIYKDISLAITIINTVEDIYQLVKAALEKISSDIQAVAASFSKPLPTVGSLINDVEQRGFEFEKDGFWDPTLGAARIGMLPAA